VSAVSATTERVSLGSRLWSLLSSRETGIFLALLLVVVATTVRNPAFLFSPDGWRDMLLTPSIVAVVAIGQAVVIITRSVDLSVGSIVGLTAYLVGTLFVAMPGFPVPLMFAVGIAFGALLGLVNGALIAFGKVPAMVITLGTLYAFRGINVAWTGSNRINASDMPDDFLALGTQQIPPTQVITGLAIILTVYIMAPVGQEMFKAADDGEVAEGRSVLDAKNVDTLLSAANRSKEPLRNFLNKKVTRKDRTLFYGLALKLRKPDDRKSITENEFLILVPAFVVSELKEAFQIGFLLFVPFLVIDMVVANILLALGMQMLSPTTISMPFKLLLFVLVDGWYLIAKGLVVGYL